MRKLRLASLETLFSTKAIEESMLKELGNMPLWFWDKEDSCDMMGNGTKGKCIQTDNIALIQSCSAALLPLHTMHVQADRLLVHSSIASSMYMTRYTEP